MSTDGSATHLHRGAVTDEIHSKGKRDRVRGEKESCGRRRWEEGAVIRRCPCRAAQCTRHLLHPHPSPLASSLTAATADTINALEVVGNKALAPTVQQQRPPQHSNRRTSRAAARCCTSSSPTATCNCPSWLTRRDRGIEVMHVRGRRRAPVAQQALWLLPDGARRPGPRLGAVAAMSPVVILGRSEPGLGAGDGRGPSGAFLRHSGDRAGAVSEVMRPRE